MKRPQNGGKAWINGEVNADSSDLIIPLSSQTWPVVREESGPLQVCFHHFPPQNCHSLNLFNRVKAINAVGPAVQGMFRWRLQRAGGDGLPHLVPAKSRWRNVTVCQYPILSSDSPTSLAWAPRPRGSRCWAMPPGLPIPAWKANKTTSVNKELYFIVSFK